MILEKDFEEFVAELNNSGVEYLIVGGYALAFHGKPRHTGDLDIWIAISEENAEKMSKAINNFGMASLGLKKEDFLEPGLITQIGYPPLRIDILNEIDGVEFAEAFQNKQTVDIDGLIINYIGLAELIKNKAASGRSQDIADLNTLNKLR